MLQLNHQHHLQVCAACCYTDPLWLLIDMHHYRAYLTWNFLKTQVGVRVFSEAKQEQEKTETELISTVGTQQSQPVTLQVRLLNK